MRSDLLIFVSLVGILYISNKEDRPLTRNGNFNIYSSFVRYIFAGGALGGMKKPGELVSVARSNGVRSVMTLRREHPKFFTPVQTCLNQTPRPLTLTNLR